MNLRALLALLGCLLAQAAPVSAHMTASRLPVLPPPAAQFCMELSDIDDSAPLTLHLDGLHDRAGPCRRVLVRQNPWSAFDPIGLSERETRELVNRTFNSLGFVGTVGRWIGLDDALTSSLNTADERMTANAAAGRGRTLSTREYVGAIAEGSAPAAKIAVVATGVAAGPTVKSFIITRPITATTIGGATVETIAGVDNGYVSPTSVVPHAPNLGTTIEVVEESARRIANTTQIAKGLSVIGPRATYREFAKKLGAKFLDVTDDAWDWAQNEKFLMEVVKRGDDVVFAGKFNPARLDPNSILAREINYLIERGYGWTDDFAKLIKK